MTRLRNRAGFTLIEVLVALLVIGIALPALMSQVLTQVEAGAYLREKTLASWIARDELERYRLQQRLPGATQQRAMSGERALAGRQWAWTLREEATAMTGIRRLIVAVGPADQAPVFSLTAYNLPALAGPGAL